MVRSGLLGGENRFVLLRLHVSGTLEIRTARYVF